MDVNTITMPPDEARKRLRAYRKQLHRKADAEFEAAAAGYEALANGRALLDMGEVMRVAPRDAKCRPRLAIARSDRQQVCYRREGLVDTFDARRHFMGPTSETLRLGFLVPIANRPHWIDAGYALVPMVPADALEAAGNPALAGCFTLWEVEQWAEQRIRSTPDRDPFLLRHLHGTLYAVLAEWNLTDLERSIMAGRRDQ